MPRVGKYEPAKLIAMFRLAATLRRQMLEAGFTDNGGAIHSAERILNILGLRICYPGLSHLNNPETIAAKNSVQEASAVSMVTEWLKQNSTETQRLTAKTTYPKGGDPHLLNIYWCVQFLESANSRGRNDA